MNKKCPSVMSIVIYLIKIYVITCRKVLIIKLKVMEKTNPQVTLAGMRVMTGIALRIQRFLLFVWNLHFIVMFLLK